MTGFFFGCGHFIAYALLSSEYFKGLRMLANRDKWY